MASFSIATSKRWKDRNTQEQKEKNLPWHNIVVFGDGLVDIVEKYVKKDQKFTLKAKFKLVNGKIKMVMIGIPQR